MGVRGGKENSIILFRQDIERMMGERTRGGWPCLPGIWDIGVHSNLPGLGCTIWRFLEFVAALHELGIYILDCQRKLALSQLTLIP